VCVIFLYSAYQKKADSATKRGIFLPNSIFYINLARMVKKVFEIVEVCGIIDYV
jgi:hypothetical protein